MFGAHKRKAPVYSGAYNYVGFDPGTAVIVLFINSFN